MTQLDILGLDILGMILFGNTPQRPRQLRGQIPGVQQQGLAAFQQCRNLAKSCFRKETGSGVRQYIILADYRMFRTVTLIALSASGDWRSSSTFQSIAGYGGLRLSFHGITQYLRSLVFVYERPIIAGVQLLMVYSTCSLLPWRAAYSVNACL